MAGTFGHLGRGHLMGIEPNPVPSAPFYCDLFPQDEP
jgi:hypothetical protein